MGILAKSSGFLSGIQEVQVATGGDWESCCHVTTQVLVLVPHSSLTDAKVAPDECFEINRNGGKYGYCRKENGTNIPCEPENVKCGRLYCTGGREFPTYGEKIVFGSCKASHYELIDDIGMVDPITKCGEGKVCFLGKCLDA
ncbi:PREDICTED: zinc metalloproteinase-disintegrin-like ohanin [Thamnophis sirtalis]|uniref:Zinc metalloproteinase-disintegrin-like ohanin n=1 Tax=Thamnophis sirtalis TaxID=35019 RepID=A0A6I9YQR0_9SAUR|nr:PREDICTED: zinc metalloproteinase-disintegrin-like ohanin [Thamnophis sirtalis]